jgi:hypothetical protein
MIFGILEADDGSIWFGALDGCIVMMDIPLPALKVKRGRSKGYSRQFEEVRGFIIETGHQPNIYYTFPRSAGECIIIFVLALTTV